MDYLDPKSQRMQRIRLWIGYALVAISIVIGCVILLWQAYGYGLKNGQVIQNGMVFLSSQPNPASIYVNGVLNPATTNTRLTIPAGVYKFELSSPGYRPWYHLIPIYGGQVIHYDYPLLFPVKLTKTIIAKYAAAPVIATQSPSQQYLVVSDPANFGSFLEYDLTNPKVPPVTLNLPQGLLSPATTSQSWQVVGWANDNQHLLLDHLYDGSQEFIELDTQNPSQSINLNKTYNVNPTSVSFNNLRYNQFYFYDSTTQILSAATIGSSTVNQLETGVLAYKSYGSKDFLYVTSTSSDPAGQVSVELDNGGTDYFVRYLPTSTIYLLNMADYNGTNYSVVGASSGDFVYIYENILSQAQAGPNPKIEPFRALKIANPNYESFAPTAQFILTENGQNFAVYDIYNDIIYHYKTSLPLDSPQTHVSWMDGDRLMFVSGGKLVVFDYDNTNRQTLTPALPAYPSFFAPDYRSYFGLVQATPTGVDLYQTSLVVP